MEQGAFITAQACNMPLIYMVEIGILVIATQESTLQKWWPIESPGVIHVYSLQHMKAIHICSEIVYRATELDSPMFVFICRVPYHSQATDIYLGRPILSIKKCIWSLDFTTQI